MPYIERKRREELFDDSPRNAGEIQYLIADIIKDYLTDNGPYNYQTLNDVMGALTGA